MVVLTDRNDLDDQLFDEVFAASKPGAPLPEAPVQAESRDHLKELLAGRESGGIVFTTIQKFGLSKEDREAGRNVPVLSDRHEHRGDGRRGSPLELRLHRRLRPQPPRRPAERHRSSGSPARRSRRRTAPPRQVFGDYIDVYDLTQAVEDGATVKVFYEPRLAKVELPARRATRSTTSSTTPPSGTEEEAQRAAEDPLGAGRGHRRLRQADQASSPPTSSRTGRSAARCWPARR